MAWLEITVNTAADTVDTVAAQLTARGFSDLVIEDQAEFETFLEENRAYWDYIDEDFQQKLAGLSRVKLYLEDTDEAGMARLKDTVSGLGLTMQVSSLPDTNAHLLCGTTCSNEFLHWLSSDETSRYQSRSYSASSAVQVPLF